MAACGSLQHIFDKPLETPAALFDPLSSCKHINLIESLDGSPTNVFGGFNLSKKIDSTLSSPASFVTTELSIPSPGRHQRSVSLSSVSSESLSEALGCESVDDIEDFNDQWERRQESRQSFGMTTKHAKSEILSGETKRSRISGKEIPPPISSIGRRVCFKSYRSNGRLILKEVKIPTQELLFACREDGRLKLQYVQFDDEVEDERENRGNVGNDDDVEIHRDCDKADNNTEKNEIREESP